MESISIFDIFKIGVGPSSSHTLGPWKASQDFTVKLNGLDFDKIQIHLYGSLSKTGKGHATDIAVILGLAGYDPITVDPDEIFTIQKQLEDQSILNVNGQEIIFMSKQDVIFEKTTHSRHPNTLRYKAYYQ